MSNILRLGQAASYTQERINIENVKLEHFVTVDNLLSDKEGIIVAEKKPLQGGTLQKYRKENILVGNIRPYLKKIWFANRDGGAAADVLVFNVKSQFCPKFVYYAMFRDDFFRHMMQGKKGTKMPRGDKTQILDYHIPNINKNSQNEIAEVLSSLDRKISINNQTKIELEKWAKTLYEYWFVQFDFPNKYGKPYKTRGGKMVWNEALKREIPEGWMNGSLLDLGNIVGGTTPSTTEPDNFTENGIPWITPKDLSLNVNNTFISRGEICITQKGMNSASLKMYPEGTVLLSSRAPIGYIAIARNTVTTNQGFKSFIPNKGYSPYFIYYTLKNSLKTIVQYATGSTFKEISGSVLKTIKIHLPDPQLVKQFTNIVTPFFKQKNILEQENQQLSSLRDWLLPMLMNGQVKVK